MKIEIEYNGAMAVCRIEPMEEPGRMVAFGEADRMSQVYALSALRTVKEHWEREQREERYRRLPETHVRREVQVTRASLGELVQLQREGVIEAMTYDVTKTPDIILLLSDRKTSVATNGWLLQDTEGRWWGMDEGYHRMLEHYGKIIRED